MTTFYNRAVLSLILLSLAGSIFAEEIDPSGTWRWESEQDGNDVKQELRIDSDKKGKLSAIYKSPAYNGALDNLRAKEVYMDGEKLIVDFDVKMGQAAFNAVYEGVVKGDDAEGDLTLSSDDGEMDLPWKAHRSVELSDVVGKWNLSLETDDGEREGVLEVKAKGDDAVATYQGENISDSKVTDLKVNDNSFSFQVTCKAGDMDVVAKFDTQPKGSKLKGDIDLNVDGSDMSASVTGEREKLPTLSDLVGTWDLLVDADGEEHKPKLIVTEDDGEVAAKFNLGDKGVFAAKNLGIKGNKLSFNMEGQLDGQDFEAKCVSKIVDTELEGAILLKLDGEEHELPMTGKRAK